MDNVASAVSRMIDQTLFVSFHVGLHAAPAIAWKR
jgi:hypothetical protein